jgi:hypothetical protein
MDRKFGSDITGLLTIGVFFPLSEAEVIELQLRGTHPLMPELLIQSVQKTVAGRKDPVRPGFYADAAQKVLSFRQLFTAPFNRHCLRRECCRYRRGRELHPRHTGCF